MKKTVVLLLLLSMLTVSTPIAAQAASNAGVQTSESIVGNEDSRTQPGTLNALTAYANARAVGVCVDYMEVDKKLFSNYCRLLGETSISGGVTWDIAMGLTLYKNGKYSTSASKRKNQTSYYCAGTKYVAGKKSQFTGNGQFRVFDDNGVKIHSKSLYID